MSFQIRFFVTAFTCTLLACALAGGQEPAKNESISGPAAVEAVQLGQTKNVHRVGSLYLAGQFEKSDVELLKQAGITRIITLRQEDELDWDEKALVETAGIELQTIAFRSPEELSDEIFDRVRNSLKGSKQTTTLLHCASANRVGGVWLAFRALDEDVDWETAVAEAKAVGMKSDELLAKAQAYVEARKPTPLISPDLNRDFLDPNLDVEQWLARFEVESREIFAQRLEIMKQCGIAAGSSVADIGAGTGLFTRLLANEVQSSGHVFAVDISPALLAHVNLMTKQLEIGNVTAVLCREDAIGLPAESVDAAFVCDTYHHFAFPKSTLASIAKALRPGGLLVIIDFDRIPGTSREWVVQHVRASKDVVRKEIEDAGFRFLDQPVVPGLLENYLIRFEKVGPAK